MAGLKKLNPMITIKSANIMNFYLILIWRETKFVINHIKLINLE